MSIHPTAVIHPEAQLDSSVEIGPYVVIEGPARIGAGTRILAHAVLSGSVELGEENTVGYGAILGAPPQDLAFKPETRSGVVIGSHNVIREYCTLHRGTSDGSVTRLGDHNFLMAGAHLGHNVEVGNRCIIANNALLGGHVKVADQVFVGGGCVFHQFMRVGRLALTQGQSAFSKDIPPFTIAAERNGIAGLNVIGLRRAGLSTEERAEIKRAFNLLFRSGKNLKQALEEAGEVEWGQYAGDFFDFVRKTKRGLCDLLGTRGGSSTTNASTGGLED